MKFRILLASAVVLSAGCSGGNDAAAPAATATAEPAAIAAPVASAQPSPFADPALIFGSGFRVVSNRVVKQDSGAMRKGIAMEYGDAGQEQAWKNVTDTLSAAGYRPGGTAKADASGKMQQAFVKDNQPRLAVSLVAKPSDNPTEATNKGTVWISWQVEAPANTVAAETETTAAAEH